MAVIGTLGKTVFTVTDKTVKTFNSLKWDSGAKYAVHDRHLKVPLLEFLGTELESISFTMYFSIFLGVNPMDEITKLLVAERNGEAMSLVIGNKAYGRNKWVIEKLSKDLERFDNKGNLLTAKVSISLKEYPRR